MEPQTRVSNLKRYDGPVMKFTLGVGLVAIASLVASCTYGPAKGQAMITNVAVRPGTRQFAVAVRVHVFRPPTGLSAFPDGGKPKTFEEYGLFYLCDAERRTARLLGRVDRPGELIANAEPWIAGWDEETLVVRFSGQSGTDTHASKEPVYFTWTEGSRFVRKDLVPSVSGQTSAGINGLPGPMILVSHGAWDIDVSTQAGRPPLRAFVLDKESGQLSP
jgi:hypothetical protein